ncbi:MAG: hypothetical protein A2Z14_10500 [Chloroflexi bacterium RBG_16_48_8]|nr:MAG: hypothetical protein A2Z14_10500 [Chloroflexi bacterium RBG_16_48_8]
MASPHVAGTVARMAQKKPDLTASEAESILEDTAIPLDPGSRNMFTTWRTGETYTWGANATGEGLLDAATALAAIP